MSYDRNNNNSEKDKTELYTCENDVIKAYLRDINKIDLLSADEEKEYAKLAERGNIEARHTLIRSNLRLVVSVAKSYKNKGLSLLDLISEGNKGLMRAIDKFEIDKGYRLSTYATWWIKQSMTRAIIQKSRTISVPIHVVDTYKKSVITYQNLKQKLKREPTKEELASAMNLSLEQVLENSNSLTNTASIDSHKDPDTGLVQNLQNIIKGCSKNPHDYKEASELTEKIIDLFEILNPREKEILNLRFGLTDGEPKTLAWIGRRYGISRERVRQVESRALKKIRQSSKSKGIREYYDNAA